MIKKIVKIILLLSVLFSILFGLYKDPNKILDEKTQNELINIADKLDNEFSTMSWNILQ